MVQRTPVQTTSTPASPARRAKPERPYAGFPLFPHATGRWAKKIRGRVAFFGPWSDPHGALQRFVLEREALYAGFTPRTRGTVAPTLGDGGGTGVDRGSPARVSLRGAGGPTAPRGATVGEGGAGARGSQGALGQGARGEGGPAGAAAHLPGIRPQGSVGAGEVLELRDLVNRYLTAKQRAVENGDLGRRSFHDCYAVAARVVKVFGPHRRVDDLGSADFGMLRAVIGRTKGPVALAAEIGRVRSIFKFGFESNLLDRPMKFGTEFAKPPRRAMRLARQAQGTRMFEAHDVRRLLELAGPQMRAMILLGLNCGMGNTDVATLPRAALDLEGTGGRARAEGGAEVGRGKRGSGGGGGRGGRGRVGVAGVVGERTGGMLDFARPKTGVARRAALWPETVAAIKGALKVRPAPRADADAGLVFVTRCGHRWVRVKEPGPRSQPNTQAVVVDAVGLEFGKLMRAAGVFCRGRGFYGLRHTFRTVADEVGDRRAIDLVMGHENGADVSHHYVERVGDERLRRVSEHVRGWYLAGVKAEGTTRPGV